MPLNLDANTVPNAIVTADSDTDAHHPNTPDNKPPRKRKLAYDIIMLGIIIIDLSLITIDLIMMSDLMSALALRLGFIDIILAYKATIHEPLRLAGDVFTVFLIIELLLRWVLSIINRDHLRWFFFPFIHWYEVLGCLPQLRALRLLRAVVIGRRLHELGYKVAPKSWIKSGQFYYSLILEEIADRVILTATDNMRQQFADDKSNSHLLQNTLDNNRDALQDALVSILSQEIQPLLQGHAKDNLTHKLSVIVGTSVQQALANTPEISRSLRLIPIAGSIIEGQVQSIGQHVSENLVSALSAQLLDPKLVDEIIHNVATHLAYIDIDNSELDALIGTVVEDALSAFEAQVKIQQWKHSEHLQV